MKKLSILLTLVIALSACQRRAVQPEDKLEALTSTPVATPAGVKPPSPPPKPGAWLYEGRESLLDKKPKRSTVLDHQTQPKK